MAALRYKGDPPAQAPPEPVVAPDVATEPHPSAGATPQEGTGSGADAGPASERGD